MCTEGRLHAPQWCAHRSPVELLLSPGGERDSDERDSTRARGSWLFSQADLRGLARRLTGSTPAHHPGDVPQRGGVSSGNESTDEAGTLGDLLDARAPDDEGASGSHARPEQRANKVLV